MVASAKRSWVNSSGLALVYSLLWPVNTRIYVDGFNLYFGAVKGTPHKWLNIVEAVRIHLKTHHVIVGTKYFTAKLNPRPHDLGQPIRQETYLRALRTLPNVEIFFGHFLTKNIRMPLASPDPGKSESVVVVKTEEKGSDVNLATQLIHDAHSRRFESAVIVSGDSDLLMPVRIVKEEVKILGASPEAFEFPDLKIETKQASGN